MNFDYSFVHWNHWIVAPLLLKGQEEDQNGTEESLESFREHSA